MAEIIQDGFRIDDDTGEVLGLVNEKPAFAVDSISSAEWVLEKFSRNEAARVALTARRVALTANLDYELTQIEKREAYLTGRFRPELEAWAKEQIAGMKQKFVSTAFGRLAFRAAPGSISVTDSVQALAWAIKNCPDAVKTTYSVLLTPLKGRNDLPADLFAVKEPGESFTITTGVK